MTDLTADLTSAASTAAELAKALMDRQALCRAIVAAHAIGDRIEQVKGALREQLANDLGPGGSQKVAGLCHATVSVETRRPVVTDAEALARWSAERFGEDSVQWATELDSNRLATALGGDSDEDRRIRDALVKLNLLVTRPRLPAQAPNDIAEHYARRDPDAPEQLLVGPIADEDGQVIPGVEIRAGKPPTLAVRIDPKARKRYEALLPKPQEIR